MKRRELLTFFVLAFTWIWGIAAFVIGMPQAVEAVFGPISLTNPVFIVAVWGPDIIAVVLTSVWYGGAGVLDLLRRFTIWRVPLRWYALCLLGMPALGFATAVAAGTFRSSPLWDSAPGVLQRMASLILGLLVTGVLGEELGWRGFALPRLLERWNPLAAGLIMGTLWGLWHLPSFLASGTPNSGTSLPGFVLGAIALSVIATWLFIHTRSSVLLAALLHLGANFALTAIGAPITPFAFALLICSLLIVAVEPRMWQKSLGAAPGDFAYQGRCSKISWYPRSSSSFDRCAYR